MSSAVHSLQKAIVAGNQPLTQLLRQAKLIAAKLGVKDVEDWVDLELNGYPDGTQPRDYRKFVTHAVEIYNPVKGWCFAGQLQDTIRAREPIATIEQFSSGRGIYLPLSKNLPVGDAIASRWPQRAIAAPEQFKHIIDAVTNDLLQWTIELERRGIKGEDMNFDEKEKQSATSQVFNIGTVHGTVGNNTNSQVTVYDYSSVQQLLIDRQIPKQDRRELEDILDELKDATPDKKPSLLKRGEAWFVRHKDLLGTAAEAIGKAIGSAMK